MPTAGSVYRKEENRFNDLVDDEGCKNREALCPRFGEENGSQT